MSVLPFCGKEKHCRFAAFLLTFLEIVTFWLFLNTTLLPFFPFTTALLYCSDYVDVLKASLVYFHFVAVLLLFHERFKETTLLRSLKTCDSFAAMLLYTLEYTPYYTSSISVMPFVSAGRLTVRFHAPIFIFFPS